MKTERNHKTRDQVDFTAVLDSTFYCDCSTNYKYPPLQNVYLKTPCSMLLFYMGWLTIDIVFKIALTLAIKVVI